MNYSVEEMEYAYTQSILGTPMSQIRGFQRVFEDFKTSLGKWVPNTIIEIGTFAGGFTLFLRHLFPETKVITYDITDKFLDKELLTNNNIELRLVDVFSNPSIIESIQASENLLLFCDGGDKPREFNTFSRYVKPGDFIFAHDYAKNDEKAKELIKSNTWRWIEATDKQIDYTNLEPYMDEDFSKIVWLCRRKK